MAKNDSKLYIDYWHEKNTSIKDLAEVHRALAKRSNQRLVRLERSASTVTGEKYDTYGAGDIAKKYLAQKNRTRFSEFTKTGGEIKLPKEMQKLDKNAQRNALIKEINQMQKFLQSKSSTVKGQKDIEAKRIETLTKIKTTEFGEVERKAISLKTATNAQFYDFLSSQTFKELTQKFDSDTIVEMYDEARTKGKAPEEIERLFNDYNERENQNEKEMREYLGLKPIPD